MYKLNNKKKKKKKENNLKELGGCIIGNTSTWKTGKKQYFLENISKL